MDLENLCTIRWFFFGKNITIYAICQLHTLVKLKLFLQCLSNIKIRSRSSEIIFISSLKISYWIWWLDVKRKSHIVKVALVKSDCKISFLWYIPYIYMTYILYEGEHEEAFKDQRLYSCDINGLLPFFMPISSELFHFFAQFPKNPVVQPFYLH